MIIESGIIIFVGFLLLALKLPTKILLTALGYPFLIDLSGSAIAYILHFGTFTGVMAAAVAGLMLSALTSASRSIFGYIEGGMYYPGAIKLDHTKF